MKCCLTVDISRPLSPTPRPWVQHDIADENVRVRDLNRISSESQQNLTLSHKSKLASRDAIPSAGKLLFCLNLAGRYLILKSS